MEILIIINLILLIFILIILYYEFIHKRQKFNGKTIDEIYSESINEANQTSKEIISEAAIKSKLLLEETKSFKATIQQYAEQNLKDRYEEFEKKLVENSNNIISLYDQLFNKLETDLITNESNAIQKINNNTTNVISTIDQKVQEEVKILLANLQQNLNKELEDSKLVLEQYKQSKINEIDQRVEAEVQRLAKTIFARVISTEEHEELIMSALDKAKKEGLFI